VATKRWEVTGQTNSHRSSEAPPTTKHIMCKKRIGVPKLRKKTCENTIRPPIKPHTPGQAKKNIGAEPCTLTKPKECRFSGPYQAGLDNWKKTPKTQQSRVTECEQARKNRGSTAKKTHLTYVLFPYSKNRRWENEKHPTI